LLEPALAGDAVPDVLAGLPDHSGEPLDPAGPCLGPVLLGQHLLGQLARSHPDQVMQPVAPGTGRVQQMHVHKPFQYYGGFGLGTVGQRGSHGRGQVHTVGQTDQGEHRHRLDVDRIITAGQLLDGQHQSCPYAGVVEL
jgi:hypothetical protein